MCKSRALKAATKEDRKEMALFIRDNTGTILHSVIVHI